MIKNKYTFTFLILFCFSNINAQNENIEQNGIYLKDTIYKSYYVYDYFRHERDSMVHVVGVILMNADSLSLFGHNEYTYKVISPVNGFLEIYYKNKLLYKYMLINNCINGTGICYYPFTSNVAVQGNFLNGKLNGFVFVLKENGEPLEVMKYKNGRYIRHLYHWLSFSKKSLKHRSRGRSKNPLKGNEMINV